MGVDMRACVCLCEVERVGRQGETGDDGERRKGCAGEAGTGEG
jgi:hypothetical protein